MCVEASEKAVRALQSANAPHRKAAHAMLKKKRRTQAVEAFRSAARFAREKGGAKAEVAALVDLGASYLDIFNNLEGYEVEHHLALELVAIMNAAADIDDSVEGVHHNMESALRWLSSSSGGKLAYHDSLDGAGKWRMHPRESVGDRKLAYEYALQRMPPFKEVIQFRGERLIVKSAGAKDKEQEAADAPEKEETKTRKGKTRKHKIEVYSLPECTYCNQAKKVIEDAGLRYVSHPLQEQPQWTEMQRRAMGCCERAVRRGGRRPEDILVLMPQIFINDKWFGTNRGSKDLDRLARVLETLKNGKRKKRNNNKNKDT
eukprot:g4070.t1